MLSAWGFVPARGGSKSIPLKNLALVGGYPLLDYGIKAALASQKFERIICSTDADAIAQRALALGVEVDRRPENLSGDEAKVDVVVREFLQRSQNLPDVIVLIQPTSPFLLPEHIAMVLDALDHTAEFQSAHTAAKVSHNCHAWNQRQLAADGKVFFPFKAERDAARNKQEKPEYYIFGNCIAARMAALMAGQGFYAEPCVAREIARPYEFDLDGPIDLVVANALLDTAVVQLQHMN